MSGQHNEFVSTPPASSSDETSVRQTAALAVILGTMTFAKQTDKAAATEMLRLLAAFAAPDDAVEFDTARLYEAGKSEQLLGELCAGSLLAGRRARVATKINAYGKRSLSSQDSRSQLAASLRCLRVPSVEILYLHGPDPKTPIEETIAVLHEMHAAGQFRELGLSNFSAEDVVYIHGFARERGWVLPTVYQGVYNYLTRGVEAELLPCLRQLGIRFYAYNPLCGGLLTGKYELATPSTEGRFIEKRYRDWYWKESFFSGLQLVRSACDEAGLSLVDAALRWLAHHSQLRGSFGDGVILGASTPAQLEGNLQACGGRPLPAEVVASLEAGWSLAQSDSRAYFNCRCRKAP